MRRAVEMEKAARRWSRGSSLLRENLLRLRLRLAAGWSLIVAAARIGSAAGSHALLHGIELLFLLIVEDGIDLRLRIFPNRLHLRAAIFPRELLILPERLHLLLAIHQNGPNLVLLIGGEIELPGHVPELFIRIHPVASMPAFRLILLRRRSAVVLGVERGPGAKRQHAAEGDRKESVPHKCSEYLQHPC